MSLGRFILAPFRTVVLQLFQRDLESKKRLDPTNFDPKFFNPFFTELFTTLTFSFRRCSAELPLNQHEK